MMIFAVDVDYRESSAISAGVMFQEWEESTPLSTLTVRVENIAEYEPGFFYKRELPCILQLLDRLDSLPTYIIIDGYVYLDNSQKPGLGKHLYDALEGRSIIIGAAKTRFSNMSSEVEVFRGESQRPLYVTAVGIEHREAKIAIAKMHGKYRIPTMLKSVDQLCRQYDLVHKEQGFKSPS